MQNRSFPLLLAACSMIFLILLQGCGRSSLESWHTVNLTEEFSADKADKIKTFADYLQLEERLFRQLDELVYSQNKTGKTQNLHRYNSGSAADFHTIRPDWNRSFELSADNPRGAVLLLHGMSDSPYSLRTLGKALHKKGYWIVGLRIPGHGTAPSGLRFIDRHDMSAAVRLAMSHLGNKVDNKPIHIIGYSTGAPLALEYTLDALEGQTSPTPSGLVLISPAIGIHPTAALSGFKNMLANIPGFEELAFLQVQPEFDPFKYNSFATNAGNIVYRLTRSVANRIRKRAATDPDRVLPPTLVIKSAVDATVTNDATVDNLLKHLKPNRHELLLFDINRYQLVSAGLLNDDPAPFTDRVMTDKTLPFTVTLVTNKDAGSNRVISTTRLPFSDQLGMSRDLELFWPPGVISLSHVALPIAPDDPLYGQRAPEDDSFLFLGQLGIQGERGILQIPTDWMFRLRYNPFYDYLENKTVDWIVN